MRFLRRPSRWSIEQILGDDVDHALGAKEVPTRNVRAREPRRLGSCLLKEAGRVHVDVWHVVRPRQELRGNPNRVGDARPDIGADVDECLAAQSENGAVAAAGHLDRAGDIAGVIDRHQMLAAVLDPFDRVPVSVRRKGNQEVFRIKVAANAEAAADVAFDQLDGCFASGSGTSPPRLCDSGMGPWRLRRPGAFVLLHPIRRGETARLHRNCRLSFH